MTKLVKTSNDIQAQDFSKALGEAFERVEKRPKKTQRMINNPAFDPLVVTGRTDTSKLNIANLPRRGDDAFVNFPFSTAIENTLAASTAINKLADGIERLNEHALAERKIATIYGKAVA